MHPSKPSPRLLRPFKPIMANVVGIDVGGIRKGYHAVHLSSGNLEATFQHTNPTTICTWVQTLNPVAVAIDAPCGWSQDGGSREAERILEYQQTRIPCFCTPTRDRAKQSSFYDWVFNGEKLYNAFRETEMEPIETYPHGIAQIILDFNGEGSKQEQRLHALKAVGIPTHTLPSPDLIDAALCALTADATRTYSTISFGNPTEGHLVLPTEKYFSQRR